MSFNLSDLRKLVKEEINKKNKINEGLYDEDPYSIGLKVMPPEYIERSKEQRIKGTGNPPAPISKALSPKEFEKLLNAHLMASEPKVSLGDKLKALLDSLKSKIGLNESQEDYELLRFSIMSIQYLMEAGLTGEAKDLLVKLIDLLDKRGLVDAVNVVGDAMRNTETGKFITSTEPKNI